MRTLLPDDTKIKNSYSLPEVARALGVSVRTIQRIVSRREIRSVRISRTTRITRECLLEYLDQNERTEEY
jgi:excisionase family DNA binding protein